MGNIFQISQIKLKKSKKLKLLAIFYVFIKCSWITVKYEKKSVFLQPKWKGNILKTLGVFKYPKKPKWIKTLVNILHLEIVLHSYYDTLTDHFQGAWDLTMLFAECNSLIQNNACLWVSEHNAMQFVSFSIQVFYFCYCLFVMHNCTTSATHQLWKKRGR